MDYAYTKNDKLGFASSSSPTQAQLYMSSQDFAQYQTDLRRQQSLNQGFTYNDMKRWGGNQ